MLKVRNTYLFRRFIIMETTSMSVKGQVVIPNKIRKALGLKPNSKLIILQDGSNILLKPIEEPRINDFKNLIAMGDEISEKLNLKRKDVGRVIKETRGEQELSRSAAKARHRDIKGTRNKQISDNFTI
jgi:antitoxin PrlF